MDRAGIHLGERILASVMLHGHHTMFPMAINLKSETIAILHALLKCPINLHQMFIILHLKRYTDTLLYLYQHLIGLGL